MATMAVPYRTPVLLSVAVSCALASVSGAPVSAQPGAVAPALRTSVLSNVAPTCHGPIPAAALQQDAAEQLRGAGVTVSDIHNAQLALDIDCLPLPGTRASGVHQCLSFSEVVTAPSNGSRAMLATTWRQCQSYACSGANCQTQLRPGLHTLVDAFLADFQQRGSRSAAAPASSVENRSPVADAIQGASRRVGGPVIFYSLYMMMCFVVLLYWQVRKQPSFR